MDATELRRLWRENNDRPAWVLEHREEIEAHTNTSEPIPSGGMHAVRTWLNSYKGVVTRQLDDDVPGTDPHNEHTDGSEDATDGGSDTTDGDEHGDEE